MAKHVRNPKLDSRAAREKLKPSGKPVYSDLGSKQHLGYRKGKSGGKWVLRRYVGEGAYVVETIAEADDLADADGVGVLTFYQAQDKARERARAHAEKERIAGLGPILTVRDAVDAYIETRERREASYYGGKARKRDARSRLTKHVQEALAATPLAALTAGDLASWRDSNSQRTINDFKAALNVAARRFKAQLPSSFRDTVRDGLRAEGGASPVAREAQVLSDADVRRIVAAAWEIDAEGGWDGDLGRLTLVLASTGARFSQVVRMTVADVQAPQRRLMIPVSRKGGAVKQLSHTGVRVGDDVLAALQAATAGRVGAEPLFLRPRWTKLPSLKWAKGERSPWGMSSELTRLWSAIMARAGLPASTVPYCLRHSSIVRGLRAGLPTEMVAKMHDTSGGMVAAHYGKFIVDALDDLAAKAIIALSPATVTPLKAVRQ
jgi:integrase